MISNRILCRFVVSAMLLALGGCGNDNLIESGLSVHLGETHTEARPGENINTPDIIPSAAQVQGGYDQANLEKHPVRDINGRTLSIYRAYVVVDNLELLPCPQIADLPVWLLDLVFPVARAHAGHGSEPVGGRSLDKPNVIDIVTQEGFVLPLGNSALAPGRYCGIRVGLVRLASEGYGQPQPVPASTESPTTRPEVPYLPGSIFAIRADYCAQTNATGQCLQRVKVDIDDGGLAEPLARTIPFDQPLELNDANREIYVVLGIAYGEWVSNLDVTLLATDQGETGKLLANIADSIHVNATGLGDLPVNIQ
jgi:hypothetical protein